MVFDAAFSPGESLFLYLKVCVPSSTFTANVNRGSIMSGTQLLRLLVNERLAAATEDIFGLVERTIAEYQDEAVRAKRDIIQLKQQIEQLTVLKPGVILFRADTQSVSEELPPSLPPDDTEGEEIPDLEETEIQEHPQVKEEQVDQCVGPDLEADTSNDAEVTHPKSEPATDCELLSPSTAETVSLNKSVNDTWNERYGLWSPHQSHSIEHFMELKQHPRDGKSCRFCGKSFNEDSHLINHVAMSHKGNKAFQCFECSKEFGHRYKLILHTRIHTGEKPFSCDYCDKTFTQKSTCLAHMRVHTGEKPYATGNHFKFTPEKVNADVIHKEEKTFKCYECNKVFKRKQKLIQHVRVHTGEKPFSCDFCGKTFAQSSNRLVHMRVHTGEKPYFCKKCGKRFTSGTHAKYCKGTPNKSTNISFHCTICGRTFYTDSDLKMHMEVHESWKRHITEKLQEQDLEKKIKGVCENSRM